MGGDSSPRRRLLMGAVKRDIHKQERRFEEFSLADEDVVRLLIFYRDQIDIYKDTEINRSIDQAGDIDKFNTSLINLYSNLDEIIEKCNFSESQKALIELTSIGYTQEDIAEILKTTQENISQRFDAICNKIVEMNFYLWKLYVHNNVLDTPKKKCSSCKTELPLTRSFFSPDKSKKDGFKGICKRCR